MPQERATGDARRPVGDAEYARLLAVRTAWRRFERWSADQAEAHGITAAQHQLLLVIRGHDSPQGPTIGQAAEHLLIRPHSAVELVNRTQRAGLIERVQDGVDHRAVRLRLSRQGERVIEELSSVHVEELRRLAPLFDSLRDAPPDV
jgi:DNA-binding MarR family transcriptional regulator